MRLLKYSVAGRMTYFNSLLGEGAGGTFEASPNVYTVEQHAQLGGLIRLLRPLNFVMFFAGVALGGLLAVGLDAFAAENLPRMLLAMASAGLIGGGANAINDVYDLDIDLVNRPERPLPSGAVSPETARRLWLGLTIFGVAIGWFISPVHGLVAAGAAVLLWAYSARLKRTPGWGNLAVAVVLGLAIYYGGLVSASGNLVAVLIGALFAFFTTLAREGAKDIEDMEGDARFGARTLPLVWGVRPAARWVLAVIFLTLLALPVLAVAGFGVAFLAFAIPVACSLLASGWALLLAGVSGTAEAWHRGAGTASTWLKVAMVSGILALSLARIG